MANAGGADPALSVEALSKQWADAVARGDGKEAQRLNVAITKLNDAARRAAAWQDRNGLTAQDRAAGAVGSAASELSSQIAAAPAPQHPSRGPVAPLPAPVGGIKAPAKGWA